MMGALECCKYKIFLRIPENHLMAKSKTTDLIKSDKKQEETHQTMIFERVSMSHAYNTKF